MSVPDRPPDGSPPTPEREPRYPEAEVHEILRRAAEMERRSALPDASDGAGGLTLGEIQDLGREAGFDPATVRRAALARIPPPPRSLATVLRGGPASLHLRLRFPGRLAPERHRGLGAALERVMGTAADPAPADGPDSGSDAPASSGSVPFVWTEDHTQGRTRIEVEEDPAGGTTVTLDADRRGWAAAVNVMGLAAGIGAGMAAFSATGGALATTGAGLLVWWGVVRAVWPRYTRRLKRRLEAALSEVVTRLEDGRRP